MHHHQEGSYIFQPFRWIYESCDVDKPFSFNGLFLIPENFCHYAIDGIIPFNKGIIPKGWYSYVFLFYHNSVIFEKSCTNLSKAFRRQTCCRNVETPGWDFEARTRQFKMFSINLLNNRRWSGVLNRFLFHLQSHLSIIHSDLVEFLKKFSELTHPKRKLRVCANNQLGYLGTIYENLYMDKIVLKLKCPEWAKNNKYGRTIGDYSVEGSLLTHGLIDYMKEVLFKDYVSFSFTIFKSRPPSVFTLRDLFHRFYYEERDLYALNSDDGMVKILCSDGTLYANLDISSCDISNGPAIFAFLLEWSKVDSILYYFVDLAIKQCQQKVKIPNPEDRRQKFYVKPVQPIEFSGSTLTTILNDLAMYLVALRFSYIKGSRVFTKNETKKMFLDCVESSGYIFSFDEVAFEGLQFFKHSPVVIDGRVYQCLNLAVLLRCVGHTKGDFPGRGSVSERGMNHTASVLRGLVHSGNTVVLRAFLERFSGYDVEPIQTDHVISGESPEDLGYFPFIARYSATISEVDELISQILTLRVGSVINSGLIRRVFYIDYGIA